MAQLQNIQYKLASRPVGLPKPIDWERATAPIPSPRDGEILIQVLLISVDPAMRGWMNEARSYVEPVKLGEVMRAATIGKVLESKNPRFSPGDHVAGMQGVQLYAISDGRDLRKVDPKLAPLTAYLGGLGMTGLTAYFGLYEVGQAKAGETVVVSAAAGAVGSIVGQLAKIRGCRAVGSAGGRAKCEYVRALGFDAAIDYKGEDVPSALREHCPRGIDIYFDNVGGEILDAALARLALHARVLICGYISQYNST